MVLKRPAAAQPHKRPAAQQLAAAQPRESRNIEADRIEEFSPERPPKRRPALKTLTGPAGDDGRPFSVKDAILATTESPSDILPIPALYQDMPLLTRYKYIHAGCLAPNWVVNFRAEFCIPAIPKIPLADRRQTTTVQIVSM